MVIYILLILLIILFILCACFKLTSNFQTSFDGYIRSKHNQLIKRYKNKKNPKNLYSLNFNEIPIYYINLKRSPKRKKFMEKQFKLYNLPFTRIEGVDGKTLNGKKGPLENNLYYINNYKVVDWKNNKNMNILGCTLSHLKAIITAYENGDDMALIFEDDISLSLCPFWKKSLQNQIKKLPKNWGAFNLSTNRKECLKSKKKILSYEHFKCCNCAAYIVNRKGMNDILKGLYKFDNKSGFITLDKKDPRNVSLDRHLISDWFIYNRTNSYTYNDIPIFFQYNVDNLSTIHKKKSIQIGQHNWMSKQIYKKLSQM